MLRPWLDLAIRLWLAQAFLAMQVREMMVGSSVRDAREPHRVLHVLTTSHAGMVVQALCPVLLALGLLARPAAAAMLLQALLLPVAGDISLFWAALLLRVVVLGPGALSIDRLLQRGAESLALPGAATLHAAFVWGRRVLGPIYQLSLRLWLAAAPPASHSPRCRSRRPCNRASPFGCRTSRPWSQSLRPGSRCFLPVLLGGRRGTRLAAVVLLAMVPFSQVASGDARLYWTLLLTVVVVQGAGPYSVDAWLASWLGRMMAPLGRTGLPHVVVVGGGFGGVAAVRACRPHRAGSR